MKMIMEDKPIPQSLKTKEVLNVKLLQIGYLEAYNMHPKDFLLLGLKFVKLKSVLDKLKQEKRLIDDGNDSSRAASKASNGRRR